jgi:hypothetical protein
VRTLLQLSARAYGTALALHVVTMVLRAVRFQLLIPAPARPGFAHALSVAAAHNMASYVLPLKTGEATLVLYLKLKCGTPSGIALAALLVSRFLDAASLCAGLAAACFSLRDLGARPSWLGGAALVLLVLALVFLLLSLRGDVLVRGLALGLRAVLPRVELVERGLTRANQLAVALRAASGGWRLTLAALLTVPMWFSIFGFFAVLARGFGIPERITFLQRALGASLASLFNLLPLNAAAGAGTQELGWVSGFHLVLGVEEGLALTSGLGVHCVQLFNVVAFGLIAHLSMGVMPRARLPDGGSSSTSR